MRRPFLALVLSSALSAFATARADFLSVGPSLALDQLPVSVGYERVLSPQFGLTVNLSALAFASVGGVYYWNAPDQGAFSGARLGVNVATPAFAGFLNTGYRWRLSERVSFDLEAGLGLTRYTETRYSEGGYSEAVQTPLWPSLGLRWNFHL